MKILVKVKPSAKQEKVEKTSEGAYSVSVKAKPTDGKANIAVVNALAEHFSVSKSRIKLLKGQRARIKIFEVL